MGYNRAAMLLLLRLALLLLLSLATVWAQTGPGSTAPAPSPEPKYALEPIAIPNAVYPTQAREQKAEGELVALMSVSDGGEVRNVHVFKGDPLLIKAVEEAVNKWKFKPVTKGGKALAVVATAKFRFVLSDDKQATDGVAPELGPATEFPQRVKVSSGVISGLLLRKVQPAYPPLARQGGVQGTVVIEAIISKDGKVADLHVVSGPPDLKEAAADAVKQWRYKSYMLMGEPVEVETQIQVNFSLRQ
jgi:TonB family protein